MGKKAKMMIIFGHKLHFMIRMILFFWLILHSLAAIAQTVIQARVQDKETRQPLSFCGIRVKASGKSCISNEDGVFRIDETPANP
jgi:hypothetical protein